MKKKNDEREDLIQMEVDFTFNDKAFVILKKHKMIDKELWEWIKSHAWAVGMRCLEGFIEDVEKDVRFSAWKVEWEDVKNKWRGRRI